MEPQTVFWRTVTSTTFWFNIITFLIAALALPEVVAVIPPGWAKAMAIVNPLGNLIIRQFITATPITRTAANMARKKAGLQPQRRANDVPHVPHDVVFPAVETLRRRESDTPTEKAPVGRTVTNTAVVKPARKTKVAARKTTRKKKTTFKVEGRD